ncbi:disease resistance protein RGA5-like [Phragmites australis]|uniref:disease resistance protein RGA5-like n=1 Tax=Phragmites australis TaxID=29695 RepID=UPI002D7A18DF|nr:disease resistance protein RGA5-like [Phragmites australis]
MQHAMVSVATGVLSPLLGKLSALVEKEYAQLKGVRKETISLQEELRSMNALLERLAAEDDPDVQVKEWRNQIRDLSYDIEDCVDDFLRRVEHDHGSKKPDVGFFQKNISKLKALGARHDIAEKIRELKARVDDVSKRRSRYNFEGASSSAGPAAAAVPIDPRLPALYATAPGSLVGIDGPREEIIKLLTEGEGELGNTRLMVVSIVGFGGLGKTTLASEVYRELGEQFDCRVIVSVSQSPDIIKIITKILSRAKGQPSHMYDARDQQDLIEELRSYLLHKRYFLVIDDIWDKHVWEVISCAFPDNNHGSRVITTTRVESVARACCIHRRECIYKMNPLNGEDSRRLFFNRIFGSQGACPSELQEVSSKILRKCGGLPLAIITIASLLASQAGEVKEYWEYLQNSMGSIVGTDCSLEVMRQILNLSYKNLPPHLKTCFLYLGAYPEDTEVWRDDLVRQWAAEGFVGRMPVGAVGVAVNCFNELVNRSMVQPVKIDYNGEVLSCRVHDMMLDLIIRKYSAEENFLTVVEHSQEIKIRGWTHSVRRLFHLSDAAERRRDMRIAAVDIDPSKLRSFSTLGSSTLGHIPPLSELKFIRVLILEFLFPTKASDARTVNLTAICKLFQLRYLKIRSEVAMLLPTQIRALQHLETLEIVSPRKKMSIALPSDVAQLPCLSYLSILPCMASLPDDIGAMRCLRSLASIVLEENSLDIIRGLRHLTNLKELYVRVPVDDRFVETAEARVDVLYSSLPEHGDCKLYLTAWSPWAWFPVVPQWVGRLEKLYSLEIGVEELCREGVAVLAGLPALVRLDLWIRAAPREGIVIAGTGFPVLKHLIVTCRALRLTFEAGAMPRLQKLKLEFNADGAAAEQGGCDNNALAGVEHLSGLKEIYARIGGFGRRTAVSALRDAIGLHPSRPRVDIICMQGRYG